MIFFPDRRASKLRESSRSSKLCSFNCVNCPCCESLLFLTTLNPCIRKDNITHEPDLTNPYWSSAAGIWLICGATAPALIRCFWFDTKAIVAVTLGVSGWLLRKPLCVTRLWNLRSILAWCGWPKAIRPRAAITAGDTSRALACPRGTPHVDHVYPHPHTTTSSYQVDGVFWKTAQPLL